MTTTRTHSVQVQGNGTSIKLEELRWMVQQLQHAPGDSNVSVGKYDGDPREPGYVTLTANVPDAPAKPTVAHR